MKKIRAAVVGYGNIGKYVVEALEAAPDFEIAGIVRRDATNIPPEISKYKIVNDISSLRPRVSRSGKQSGASCSGLLSVSDPRYDVDVAILCSPSRKAEVLAAQYLAIGIRTVDSFDIHTEIAGMRSRLDEAARAAGSVAVIAAGWDPGSDSVVRALLEACAPAGTTCTNFGPGMSMGHTVAAKAVAGIRDALSMTIPAGGGVHNRKVYVETVDGADFDTVAAAIEADPYFAKDHTEVELVESVTALVDVTHGVNITRNGVSGRTDGQKFEYSMRINNPALTAQILVSSARAAMRQHPGAYTMIELPPIDLLPGDRDGIIRRLV